MRHGGLYIGNLSSCKGHLTISSPKNCSNLINRSLLFNQHDRICSQLLVSSKNFYHTASGFSQEYRISSQLFDTSKNFYIKSTGLSHNNQASSQLFELRKNFYQTAAGLSQISRISERAMAAVSVQHLHDPDSITYLKQNAAVEIDELLMGPLGFSVDQLMELAGLSVASAIAEVYSVLDHSRVLVLCGPGNNGGDGLVAARHLHHFGYKPCIVYPKRTDKPLYKGLVTQLESLNVPFMSPEDLPQELSSNFDIVVDAMFGFSFKGVPRPPFDDLIQRIVHTPNVVSIDVPSGWHVEEGDVNGLGLNPDMLVSLTAPKMCAKMFKGPHHFLGGRFVPPAITEKYGLKLPPYPGTSQCVRIGKTPPINVANLRENYVGSVLLEEQVNKDPIKQFQEWFEDAVAAGLPEPNAMTLATADAEARPSARMSLLKGYDERGFVWYTNYNSRKAKELAANPQASLVFFWNALHRQVRIEGDVSRVSDEESDAYFHSRPRESQIGALVSSQSSVIPGRHVLDESYEQLVAKYADRNIPIPRPAHWGGFRLKPRAIEFWQGRESRLHDRILFTRVSDTWKMERLSP